MAVSPTLPENLIEWMEIVFSRLKTLGLEVEILKAKVEGKEAAEEMSTTRHFRCATCGTMIDVKDGEGPVCPNGHTADRIYDTKHPDAGLMEADFDGYLVTKAQEASRIQDEARAQRSGNVPAVVVDDNLIEHDTRSGGVLGEGYTIVGEPSDENIPKEQRKLDDEEQKAVDKALTAQDKARTTRKRRTKARRPAVHKTVRDQAPTLAGTNTSQQVETVNDPSDRTPAMARADEFGGGTGY